MSVQVTLEDVERVAELANLDLAAEEKPRMQRDLNAILEYAAQLNELETRDVEPLAQIADLLSDSADSGVGAALRADGLLPSLDRAAVMAGAPETDGAFFKTPKVIER